MTAPTGLVADSAEALAERLYAVPGLGYDLDYWRGIAGNLIASGVVRPAAEVRAEAWDKGEKAGMQNHSAYQNTGRPAHVNPYRAALAEEGGR